MKRSTVALCLEYPLEQMGGVEILVKELINSLPETFNLVLVSADKDFSQCSSTFRARIKTHFFWNHQEATLIKARQLAQNLSDCGVDLVHFHLGSTYSWETHKFWKSPVYYCRHFGLPHLLTNHSASSLLEGYANPNRSALTRACLFPKAWLSREIILWNVPCEVTVSRHDQKRMQRFFPLHHKQFSQFYHSRLSRQDIEAAHEISIRDKTIVCIGTLGQVKGQLFLARAFAQLANHFPGWTLQFIGRQDDPAYQQKLEQIQNFLPNPNQILLQDAISDFPSLQKKLQSVGLYVQPSLVEGLGLALQEALSQGCPSIGSNAGGIPELIEHGVNGLLVPPGDEVALTEALEKLLSDEVLRGRLGDAAPKKILQSHMTREDMVAQHVELYQQLLTP